MKYTSEYQKNAYMTCTTTTNFKDITNDELLAAIEWAKKLRFYANMGNSWKVTCTENYAINKATTYMVQEMKKRGIY